MKVVEQVQGLFKVHVRVMLLLSEGIDDHNRRSCDLLLLLISDPVNISQISEIMDTETKYELVVFIVNGLYRYDRCIANEKRCIIISMQFNLRYPGVPVA